MCFNGPKNAQLGSGSGRIRNWLADRIHNTGCSAVIGLPLFWAKKNTWVLGSIPASVGRWSSVFEYSKKKKSPQKIFKKKNHLTLSAAAEKSP